MSIKCCSALFFAFSMFRCKAAKILRSFTKSSPHCVLIKSGLEEGIGGNGGEGTRLLADLDPAAHSKGDDENVKSFGGGGGGGGEGALGSAALDFTAGCLVSLPFPFPLENILAFSVAATEAAVIEGVLPNNGGSSSTDCLDDDALSSPLSFSDSLFAFVVVAVLLRTTLVAAAAGAGLDLS